MNETGAEKLR